MNIESLNFDRLRVWLHTLRQVVGLPGLAAEDVATRADVEVSLEAELTMGLRAAGILEAPVLAA